MNTLPQPPIQVLHLFPVLDQLLLDVLGSLTIEQWNEPTLAKQWTVKDIAAHLLDGNLRTLSMLRDNYFTNTAPASNGYNDVVQYLNSLNADWVNASKRLSPQILINLLESSGTEYSQYLHTLSLNGQSVFPVAWAGQTQSLNWFHIAREYTEKWHHQQQIRQAVHKPGLMDRELFYPFIDTCMQALPHVYSTVPAPENTCIKIIVTTEAGGCWYLKMKENKWLFVHEPPGQCKAEIAMHPETAWKLFTKGIGKREAQAQVETKGDQSLAEVVLNTVAVMA